MTNSLRLIIALLLVPLAASHADDASSKFRWNRTKWVAHEMVLDDSMNNFPRSGFRRVSG
jgi:hypothetical protein